MGGFKRHGRLLRRRFHPRQRDPQAGPDRGPQPSRHRPHGFAFGSRRLAQAPGSLDEVHALFAAQRPLRHSAHLQRALRPARARCDSAGSAIPWGLALLAFAVATRLALSIAVGRSWSATKAGSACWCSTPSAISWAFASGPPATRAAASCGAAASTNSCPAEKCALLVRRIRSPNPESCSLIPSPAVPQSRNPVVPVSLHRPVRPQRLVGQRLHRRYNRPASTVPLCPGPDPRQRSTCARPRPKSPPALRRSENIRRIRIARAPQQRRSLAMLSAARNHQQRRPSRKKSLV
jgi:hypothetical protein